MIEIGDLLGMLTAGTLIFGGIGGIVWKMRRDLATLTDEVGDMRTVPLSRICDARDEQMVRLAGRVSAEGVLLKAPVSGRRCVAWEIQIWDTSLGVSVMLERQDSMEFAIDDGSGRAHVVARPTIWALNARIDQTGAGDEVPPTFAAWLKENHASDEWRSLRHLHWRESRVEPGDELAVVGIAHVAIGPDGNGGGYRDAPVRVAIDGADDAPLSFSDDPSLLRRG